MKKAVVITTLHPYKHKLSLLPDYKRVIHGLCFLLAVITDLCLVTTTMVTKTMIFKNLSTRSLTYSTHRKLFCFLQMVLLRGHHENYKL